MKNKKLFFALFIRVKSNTVRNLFSARVSMPPKVFPVYAEDKKTILRYEWKVDLMKSQEHWISLIFLTISYIKF